MQKQITNLWKHDSEYYFADLVRDLKSSPFIASVTLIDNINSVEKYIERRRYRAYLNYQFKSTKWLRYKLMKELQVAVSPTNNDYTIEIIGIYKNKQI